MNGAVRALYNLLLPPACLLAAPAWLLKMTKRGGFGPKLWERLGIYDRAAEFERSGAIYVHAVSVGEVMIALKLIAEWRRQDPEAHFVLAATTATGFALANERAGEQVRAIYCPLDMPVLLGRLFRRFEPRAIVLVDSELWPNLLHHADKRGIPVALVNARLSPRSEARYRRFAAVTGPMLGLLKLVCAQAPEHARAWTDLGVPADRVVVTGSVKFDPEGLAQPTRRPEFAEMLETFGAARPVVLGVSTHAGEEALVAQAVAKTPGALAVILPRHAERGGEVQAELEQLGFEAIRRSAFRAPRHPEKAVFVVDSTGELRDWTAHADVAVIGKSFLARGGQNPTEAIAARVPVICGPEMGNFEPLISQLREAGGVRMAGDDGELTREVPDLLGKAGARRELVEAATTVLARHAGATARSVGAIGALLRSHTISK